MQADTAPQTILVIDDNPDNIDVLNNLLRPDYTVKAALNAARGLALARAEHKPDLILLDVMMPVMDGYELCQQLKNDPSTSNIPVIFITARSYEEDEKKGLALGAVDYITKPINPDITLARIRTHLALADQNKQLARQVLERTKALRDTRLTIIRCLARAAEYNDNQTGLHVIRMSHYSRILALAYSQDPGWADLIFHASPMHDIGKIGIPDSILLKQGALTGEEWTVMRRHPEIGAEIIGDDPSRLMVMAREIAMAHHEKWDGSGYPLQLAGEQIPVSARIVAIADVFDALTSVRPYKDKWKMEHALAEIRNKAGTHFDPALVALYEKVLPEIIAIHEQYGD